MFLKYNYAGITWAALILVFCGLPGSQLRSGSELIHADKVIHVILFCVLQLLLTIGFIKQHAVEPLRKQAVWKALLIGTCYGATIEVLQSLVFIDRTIEVGDLLANAGGSLLGVAFFYFIYGTESYV